ncbi:SsrA-binding protein SmpB [Chloracidobacterium thermophilum]|uniref:SsrA-binding protein SmpB n=1 Tax=Chloracidobacterium thermophilum TaxID=458033 RepID=UPI0007387D7F|nr:SsrA-binding protein SmpB [Chloracidobacterium thermophilum]
MTASTTDGIKLIASNREAYFDYFIRETYEAGLELVGTEVKALREGRVNLKEAYVVIRDGEAWLMEAHISPYSHGNRYNHDPRRTRRLLLHKREIAKLAAATQERGLTVVPTRLYFKRGRAKVEVAIAKGKKTYDKRETERRRDLERETRAALKSRS